jgi:hypothetical protein
MAALRSEREGLVRALEDAEGRLGAAAEQIAAAERQRLSLMAEAHEEAAVRDAAKEHAQEMRAAAEASTLQAAEAAEALAEARTAAADMRRRLVAAEGELRTTRSALSDANTTAAAHGAAADALTTEVARLRDELASTRAAAARLAESAHAADAAEAALSEARSEATAARASAARAVAGAAASNHAARALEAHVAQLAADAALAKRQASSARAKAERMRGQLLDIRADVSEWAAEGSDEDSFASNEGGHGRDAGGPGAGQGRSGGSGTSLRARDVAALQEQAQLLQVSSALGPGTCGDPASAVVHFLVSLRFGRPSATQHAPSPHTCSTSPRPQSLLGDAREQLSAAAADRERERIEAQRREDALATEASRLRGELAVASARLEQARRLGERRVQLLAEVAASAEAEAERVQRGAEAVRTASGLELHGLQLEVGIGRTRSPSFGAVCSRLAATAGPCAGGTTGALRRGAATTGPLHCSVFLVCGGGQASMLARQF